MILESKNTTIDIMRYIRMSELRHIFIVYNPGYAGNFLQRLISLDTSTVPALYKDELSEHEYEKIDNADRLEKYKFSKIKKQQGDWQQFHHRAWVDFFDYKETIKISGIERYKNICFAMHEPEYTKCKNLIDQIENKIIFGVFLDEVLHSRWLTESQKSLRFLYRLEEKQFYQKMMSLLPKENIIDLNRILESEVGFLNEYQRICQIINIEYHPDEPLELYRDWSACRV